MGRIIAAFEGTQNKRLVLIAMHLGLALIIQNAGPL